jgi:hypothetical protein
MNFLSHYFFHRSAHAYFNTGLVLPDLVRNICKTHLKPLPHYEHPQHQILGQGSQLHIEGDRIFHQSDFFTTCEHYIGDQLDLEAGWPRKWFLNHLLLEIALDRVLMDLYPTLCEEFYAELEQVSPEIITTFLDISHVDGADKFKVGFENFVRYRFLFEYAHNEKIIFALSRVYLRTGIHYEWTDADRNLLLSKLRDILEFIGTKIAALKNELEIK